MRARDKESDFEMSHSGGVGYADSALTPIEASHFRKNPMSSICKMYQPAKCWKTGDEFPSCKGDCSKCGIGSFDSVPAIGEIETLYKAYAECSTRVRPVTVKANMSAWRSFVRLAELDSTAKTIQISEQDFSRYVIAARRDGYAEASIESAIEKIHNIFSSEAIRYWKSKDIDAVRLPSYSFRARIVKWVSLTRNQRQKLRAYELDLFDLADPRKALCMVAAWERGQRKQDVLRQHWSKNFIERDGYIWWDYTANKNGKMSSWPVDPDTWLVLKKLHKRLDALREHRLGKFPDSYLRVREFSSTEVATSEIWDSVGHDLRLLMGWDGAKAMHNLRKDATDQIFQNLGTDEACEFSGDTPDIIKDHYTGKKRIDPRTISPAKM